MKSGKTLRELQNYINRQEQKRALVIGDIMLDRYIYGTIDRLSPESNAPVLAIKRDNQMAGGAGNVTANLQGLGLTVTTLAMIGDDEPGRALCAMMDDDRGLIRSRSRPTTCKTRYLSGSGHLLRVDHESRDDISAQDEERLLEQARPLIADSGVIILSDYNKGVLTPRVIRDVITAARAHDVPVLVDPKKKDCSLYKGAALLTPNRTELAEYTDLPAGTDEEVTKAAHRLMLQAGLRQLVVTRSEDGLSVFTESHDPVHIANETTEVVDVSGAGDTVIAVLAAAIASGADIFEAARLAVKAASVVVSHSGTAQISLDELKGTLDNKAKVTFEKDRTRQAGLYSPEEAAQLVAAWKRSGFKTGFTNGCFDILHYGHVNYLNRARDKCDRLIVALNHDRSVRLLKGPERPLHDQDSRAAVIGALGAVDMVVFFGAEKEEDDNTPCALLETVKPDIYFKGGDYTIEQLPEAKIMEKIGGSVEIMPLYDGHSTTSTIEKMKKTGAA